MVARTELRRIDAVNVAKGQPNVERHKWSSLQWLRNEHLEDRVQSLTK